MSKLLLSILLSFLSCCAYAQNVVSHIVQRGETLEYIAKKYGVSEQAIKDYNKDFDPAVFFIGLPLQIPLPQKETVQAYKESFSAVQSASDNSLISEANALFSNGQYRKAAKLYSKVIKSTPNSDAYYMRGRCYYGQGKYKSAIKDLKVASEGSDLSPNFKRPCIELLVEAEEKREEQLDSRYEMWGNIFAATAVTAATVVTAKALDNNNYVKTTPSTYKTASSGTVNLPPALQPEIAAKNAVAQINYQMKVEEENFKSNYRTNFKRTHGREPSEQEVMNAYTNYLKVKNDAYKALDNSSDVSYDDDDPIEKPSRLTKDTSKTTKDSSDKGWYKCCADVANFGITTYHTCPNCGSRHIERSGHECKRR